MTSIDDYYAIELWNCLFVMQIIAVDGEYYATELYICQVGLRTIAPDDVFYVFD
jgi:hypothetical protein